MAKQSFDKFFLPSRKVIADKAFLPEETIRLVEERLKSLGAKVYKGVKRIDKGRLGLPVFLSFYDVDGVKTTGNYKQMGKGATEILAKASALVELVERYSLFSFFKRAHQQGILATFEELKEEAIPWEVFLKSLEDEEDERVKGVALKLIKKFPFYFVPALEVRTKEVKYLPFHWFWMLYEYNGSAGGNTYPEASVQAICELIERHTNALSIRFNKPLPAIKRESIKGAAEEVLKCFERLNIRVWIRDMTFGMPAPTVAVMAMDPSTYPERSEIVYAAGTGTSPERALIRALTEVAQLAGDFDTEGKYVESGLPKFQTLEEAKIVIEYDGDVELNSLTNVYSEDHVEELNTLAQKLKDRGFETYLIDLTNEELNLPAVYAVIPGILFRERTKIPFLFHLVRASYFYHPREVTERLINEVLSEVPDRYYVWGFYGNLLKDRGDLDSAISCYERALSLEPQAPDKLAILTHLADAYLTKGEYLKAISACEQALECGEAPEVYNLLGRSYYKLHEFSKALEYFLKATELDPSSAIDYANAGFSLKSIGEGLQTEEARMLFLSQAKLFFLKALSLNPDLEMAKRGLAYCEEFVPENN